MSISLPKRDPNLPAKIDLPAEPNSGLRQPELPGGELDEFERAFGTPLAQAIDTDNWAIGADLPALYKELEVRVQRAVEEEEGRREHIRRVIFPRIALGLRAVAESGLHKFGVADIERAHSGLLFNGAVEACDGTSVTHDTLPITITQIGVVLVSYNGPRGSYVHRLFRKDLQGRVEDPIQEIVDLLEARRRRESQGYRDEAEFSELARRGIQAYAERAILLEKSGASWRMGHGHPTPYELLTGYWASRIEMVNAALVLMRRLVAHERFVFVPSAPRKRELLTLGYALNPLEYLILWNIGDDLLRMLEAGGYRGEVRRQMETFMREVGPHIVMGLFRVSDLSPPYLFYAHRDHVHIGALIAMADGALLMHRGFPMLIHTADRLCAAEFSAGDFKRSVRQAYAESGGPFRYLGERETRQ